eukprot:3427113-Amphidinium_carterae.2
MPNTYRVNSSSYAWGSQATRPNVGAKSQAITWLNGLDIPPEEQRLVLSSAGACEVEKIFLSIALHFPGQTPPSRKGGKGEGKQYTAHVTEEVLTVPESDGTLCARAPYYGAGSDVFGGKK